MGLLAPTMKWIYMAKLKYKINFDHMLTLGRQYCEPLEWKKAEKQLRNMNNGQPLTIQQDGYTENFWRWLGSKKTDFLDYSDYEGANIVWDLNQPIPNQFREKYSVVVDGGTMEHVFNYPQAIKNAMEMVEVGGHLILLTPADGWCGHGFYQFSPCLFWDLLNETNGYSVLEISLLDVQKIGTSRMLQRLTNRNNIKTKERGTLLIVAKRVGNIPQKIEAQQGSYCLIWEGKESYWGPKRETRVVMDSIKVLAKKSKIIVSIFKKIKNLAEHKNYYNLDEEIKNLCTERNTYTEGIKNE